MNLPQRSQRAQRKASAELVGSYPTRRSFCVNAVDKGVRSQKVGREQLVVGSVSALRDRLKGLTGSGNMPSCGGKEGRDGDTVSRTLTKVYCASGYLSSDKLKAMD